MGPFDGRVAAVIGNWLYTTPHEEYIPIPSSGEREVRLREDYRFGPDDPTCWPQPYSERFPHLGFIARPPDDPNDPLHFLRWNPIQSDFVASTNGLAAGMGRLAPEHVETFKAHVTQIRARYSTYEKRLDSKSPNVIAALLNTALSHSFIRLKSLPATYTQIRFGVTELQRLILELRAVLDYLEIYKPIMDGAFTTPPSSTKYMGAFTTNPRVVQDFHIARVPVWYVRSKEIASAEFVNNILVMVEPRRCADTVVVKQHKDFPVILKGKADSALVLDYIHGYSRRWLSNQEPFDHENSSAMPSTSSVLSALPAGPSSSTSISSQTTSQNGPRPAKRQKTTASANPRPKGMYHSGLVAFIKLTFFQL